RMTEGGSTASFPNTRDHRLTYISRADGRAVVQFKDLQSGQTTQLKGSGGEPTYPQLCADGETVVYSDGPNTFAATARSLEPRLVCNGCSRVWQCTSDALFNVPAGSKSPIDVYRFALPSGPNTPLLVSSGHD